MQRSALTREVFLTPAHIGEAKSPNFVGRAASFDCGALVSISLHVDESQKITDAKFKAAGCSELVASTSFLIDRILGKPTAEAAAIGQDTRAISKDGLLDQSVCARLAGEALVNAIQSYSGSARHEWEGDDALICTCFCVSEQTIAREIRANNLTTIAQVTAACSAGGGCRSCYSLIEDIIETVNGKW